jgi:hypothetical protein
LGGNATRWVPHRTCWRKYGVASTVCVTNSGRAVLADSYPQSVTESAAVSCAVLPDDARCTVLVAACAARSRGCGMAANGIRVHPRLPLNHARQSGLVSPSGPDAFLAVVAATGKDSGRCDNDQKRSEGRELMSASADAEIRAASVNAGTRAASADAGDATSLGGRGLTSAWAGAGMRAAWAVPGMRAASAGRWDAAAWAGGVSRGGRLRLRFLA